MEKAVAPHSSTLAWKIPWTEEPSRLQSMGSLRVRHDWLHFHFSLSCIGEGNGNPLQCFCLEKPRDGGAWWAAVYGDAQSRTRLKWLSSSSRVIRYRLRIRWYDSNFSGVVNSLHKRPSFLGEYLGVRHHHAAWNSLLIQKVAYIPQHKYIYRERMWGKSQSPIPQSNHCISPFF